MNSDYNLEHEIEFGQQKIHIKNKVDYSTCAAIAVNVTIATHRIEEDTGVVTVDAIAINPLLVASFVREFTDADLSVYVKENGLDYYAVYDDAYDIQFDDAYCKLEEAYAVYSSEYLCRLEQSVSPARVLRDISKSIIDMEGKDMSVVRSLLTGLMTNKKQKANASEDDNVFDLSAYKVKK